MFSCKQKQIDRFVFRSGVDVPASAPKVAVAAAPKERPDFGLVGPSKDQIETEIKKNSGEEVKLAEVKSSPEKFADFLVDMIERWSGSLDKLFAIFAPLGVSSQAVREKIEDVVPQDHAMLHQNDAADSTDAARADGRNAGRAKHGLKKIGENPEWKNYIQEATQKYGFRESVFVSFVEMESTGNPQAKTGRAIGLAQAMPDSVDRYRRQVNPNADLYDPKTAIDFLGWHLTNKIADANRTLARNSGPDGFPESYRLDAQSPVKYLYMAYNNGGYGYLLLRRFLEHIENATDPKKFAEEEEKLVHFQKELRNGTPLWEIKRDYAERVSQVAAAYEKLSQPV